MGAFEELMNEAKGKGANASAFESLMAEAQDPNKREFYGQPIQNEQGQYQVGGPVSDDPLSVSYNKYVIDPTAAAAEGLAAMGTGAVADLYSNYGAALTGGGPEAKARIQEALTYQPKTEAGRKFMGAIAGGMQSAGETVGNLKVPFTDETKIRHLGQGERALENVGGVVDGEYQVGGPIENQLQARLIEATPSLAQAALTATGMPSARSVPVNPQPGVVTLKSGFQKNVPYAKAPPKVKIAPTGEVIPSMDKIASIKQKLINKSGDKNTAKWKIGPKGKVIPDKYAKAAIKQGFDEGKIGNLATASKTDKLASMEMIKRVRDSRVDPKTGVRNRPIHVIGDELSEMLTRVKKVNNISGKEVQRTSEQLKGVPIDISKPVGKFDKFLTRQGVQIKIANGTRYADFTNSKLPKGARPVIKEIIRHMDRLTKKGKPDAYAAHDLKEVIYDNVKYGNRNLPAGDKTELALKQFANGLNKSMRNVSPAYKQANKTYSETIEILGDFQKYVGKDSNLFDQYSPRALSNISRRIMGNAQSGGPIMRSADDLQRIANKYGGKFDGDLNIQLMVADELDTVFKSAAPKSLQGEVGKEIARASAGGGRAVATDLAEKTIDAMRGINEENAIKAFQAFIHNSM